MSESVSHGRDASRQADTLEAAGAGAARRRGRGRRAAAGAGGRVRPGRAAGGGGPGRAPAGDRDRGPAGPVGDHAGDRDAGVRELLPGDREGRRDADLAAAGRAGDQAGAGAVQGRQRRPGGAAIRQRPGLAADVGRGYRRGRFPAQPRPGAPRVRRQRGHQRAGLGLLLLGDPLRGTADGRAPGGLQPAGVAASLGGPAGGPVLNATSTRHVVTISLDASQQTEVKAGDTVTVTLPDGKTTPGTVSWVGRVAVSSAGSGGNGGSGGSGGSGTSTIPVRVTLTHPKAAGTLDQAPVTVNISTGSVKNALAVPVGALLAHASRRSSPKRPSS